MSTLSELAKRMLKEHEEALCELPNIRQTIFAFADDEVTETLPGTTLEDGSIDLIRNIDQLLQNADEASDKALKVLESAMECYTSNLQDLTKEIKLVRPHLGQ